jgi:UDP-N-acetylmuramate dehydrogenase
MTCFEPLITAFGPDRVHLDAPLAPFTTFKVGGPADCLVDARTSADLVRAFELARAHGLAVAVLGGGSNLLVSDAGVRGVVVRARGGVTALEGGGRVRADAGVSLNSVVRWTI